jgi:hypothetical protein
MSTIRKGSRLAVNLAPFIGSTLRSKHHVPCQAIELREGSVLVRTEAPYRSISLWVETNWVDQVVESADTPAKRIAARVTPS